MKTNELEKLGKPYRIFADYVEHAALSQFMDFMRQDCVLQGALMPDVHAGYSLPIGAVIACDGFISPQAVGYDIGCGMCAILTPFNKDEVKANSQQIFDAIYELIPVGSNHNSKTVHWSGLRDLTRTNVVRDLLNSKGSNDLHSLGGGNHFIEIGYDELDRVWIVIHSGSRHMGHSVAKHYMSIAGGDGRAHEGFYGFTENSEAGRDYIIDLQFCLEYALENRRGLIGRVFDAIQTHHSKINKQIDWSALINRNHNHAEKKDGLWIHRKGATHAEQGMMGVISGNMRDGSFIVCGKGNPESLYSSSHGAGRVMGRAEAKRQLDMETFIKDMSDRGIQARIEPATLDESAGAYKNIFEVMAMQPDLVTVIHHITPMINIKG